ncbi:putative sucrose transport protein [Dendryphion nanum]|uniref:Sucrose transport protein n=1 Tax=Dendryphion nanum TaxID=256645 RepID=A0A9P9EK04_9PLEO|nr:putative sucrose transport protein [Dendryphion nanum]
MDHHFDPSSFDSDSSTITSDAMPRMPTRLLIALTCGIGGLQLVWSTIFSHGSAYLFSLGITKSQSSLIWAIAPICGVLIQPIAGALSDNSRSRWGRRRPFILGGAIGVVISLIALSWVSNIMHTLTTVFGHHSSDNSIIATQIGTILCIILLNMSVQPLQSGLRALIIDVCSSEQQNIASAWAGRFTGIGNILGYMLGSLPLGSISEDNEAWRFRFLSLLSVAILLGTVLTTTYFIREEDPRELAYEPKEGNWLLRTLLNVRDGWSYMPLQARRVCLVQFFAWMGWFGFLFYSTSFVGRLYVSESRRRGIEHFDLLGDAGIRLGTFASLLSAITALATTILVPYIASANSVLSVSERAMLTGFKSRTQSGTWRQTHILWALSLFLYALCTMCTTFVSTNGAILFITLTGISWGVTQWAPFALIGEEIAMHQGERESTIEKGGRQWMTNQSGAILGVHNAAISIPQILAALGSSFIFRLSNGNRYEDDNGISWILRASGVATLFAAFLAWRLK